MTLEQLGTPFENRMAYTYSADGNTVVCRRVKVQQVCGALYRGETEDNNGWKECALYCFLPDVKAGIKLFSRILNIGQELMPDGMPQNIAVWGTREEWLSMMDEHVANGGLVRASAVEFIRQFAPEKAEAYGAYRAEWYRRRAEEEEAWRREKEEYRKAEEEAEKVRRQAELDAAKGRYFGWADTMTPLRFGKVRSKMEGLIRSDGRIMQLLDFIVSLVRDGWEPVRRDGVTSWYGSKWEPKQSKPRTEYTLSKDGYSYKISKTEYDFAVYLTERKEIWNQG